MMRAAALIFAAAVLAGCSDPPESRSVDVPPLPAGRIASYASDSAGLDVHVGSPELVPGASGAGAMGTPVFVVSLGQPYATTYVSPSDGTGILLRLHCPILQDGACAPREELVWRDAPPALWGASLLAGKRWSIGTAHVIEDCCGSRFDVSVRAPQAGSPEGTAAVVRIDSTLGVGGPGFSDATLHLADGDPLPLRVQALGKTWNRTGVTEGAHVVPLGRPVAASTLSPAPWEDGFPAEGEPVDAPALQAARARSGVTAAAGELTALRYTRSSYQTYVATLTMNATVFQYEYEASDPQPTTHRFRMERTTSVVDVDAPWEHTQTPASVGDGLGCADSSVPTWDALRLALDLGFLRRVAAFEYRAGCVLHATGSAPELDGTTGFATPDQLEIHMASGRFRHAYVYVGE